MNLLRKYKNCRKEDIYKIAYFSMKSDWAWWCSKTVQINENNPNHNVKYHRGRCLLGPDCALNIIYDVQNHK